MIIFLFVVVIFDLVGPGGSPNEKGETMLDALVMDGVNNNNNNKYLLYSQLRR